uniref:Uncharacterized protein n=1 Tax=Knipowitschia caucasica TaxID=637954 RepID=A0AAV2KRG6_KNICA
MVSQGHSNLHTLWPPLPQSPAGSLMYLQQASCRNKQVTPPCSLPITANVAAITTTIRRWSDERTISPAAGCSSCESEKEDKGEGGEAGTVTTKPPCKRKKSAIVSCGRPAKVVGKVSVY